MAKYLDETGLAHYHDAIEAKLDLKAPLASPALTGTPTAPTAASGTNTTQIATTAFVQNAKELYIAEVGSGSFVATAAAISAGKAVFAKATITGSDQPVLIPYAYINNTSSVIGFSTQVLLDGAPAIISVELGTSNPAWSSVSVTPLIDITYPVGSIYMSVSLSTASAVRTALGGGTWVAWGTGRVPVGVDTSDTDFDTAEETGGEKTHTLTTDEMPSHNHDVPYTLDNGAPNDAASELRKGSAWTFGGYVHTDPTGGGASHNNLQPYITCYMWKRTA